MNKTFTNSAFFLIALLFCLKFSVVKGDLPVHCLKHQIVGSWELYLTEAITSDPAVRVTCDHDSPDNPATSFLAMQQTFTAEKTISVDLKHDDSVSEEGGSSNGYWTMIYDEGFEIRHKNIRFFAFSQYVQTPTGYKSQCSETLVGWYHDYTSDKKGCFKAKKSDGSSGELTSNVKQAYVVEPEYVQEKEKEKKEEKKEKKEYTLKKEITPAKTHFSFETDYLQKSEKNIKLNKLSEKKLLPLHHHIHQPSEHINFGQITADQHKLISERLNTKVKKSWVAGVHPQFKSLSLTQLNQRAGRKKLGRVISEDNQAINSFIELERTSAQMNTDVSDLPLNFDWKEYLQPPKSQGDCGSCYVFATLAMLQARLKIQHKESVVLSVQHSINCNFYNQGCDGGYPFLVEKYANEYGLVEESCSPYRATNGKCEDTCTPEKTYHVKDYRFVGGSYGKCNEREMMLEIMNNGPIVVSFEPQYDFMYYESGIYHSVPAADWILNGEEKPEWEKVDHSVLCYGWGEENGEKYWLLQNTWGTDWGERGFFRMRRGTDESHIESLAEAADPYVQTSAGVFLSRKTKLFLNKKSI